MSEQAGSTLCAIHQLFEISAGCAKRANELTAGRTDGQMNDFELTMRNDLSSRSGAYYDAACTVCRAVGLDPKTEKINWLNIRQKP